MELSDSRERDEHWEANGLRFALTVDLSEGSPAMWLIFGLFGLEGAAGAALMMGSIIGLSVLDTSMLSTIPIFLVLAAAVWVVGLAIEALTVAALVLALVQHAQPLQVHVDPGRLELGGYTWKTAEIRSVQLVEQRLQLALHDGSTWSSRRVWPRDSVRVVRLLSAAIPTEEESRDRVGSEARAKRALAALRQAPDFI